MDGRLNKLALFEDLGYTPHAGQLELHKSTAPRRIVACGVRWGKSLSSAMEGVAAAMEPKNRSVGWVVAPTYDLADRVFREIKIIVAEKLMHRVIKLSENDRHILLRNMAGGVSEIRAKSADNPTSLLGEGLDWLIVDEASRLKPSIWQGHLSQRLIDKKGWALLISTPKGKGWFWDLHRRGKSDDPDYESWNYPSWTNPVLPRDMIERERNRLPERVFLQEYGAEFIEGSGQVFRNVRECATGTYRDPEAGTWYSSGIDLAKVEDYTVICVMDRQKQVVFTDRFHRLDWSIQVARLKAATERYNNTSPYVDSTGAGEPVLESLRREGVNGIAYPFTKASKDALINNLALIIERKEVVLPRPELWPVGVEELEAFEYSVSESTGNVRMSAPSGMHDDCVMALALAAWGVRGSMGPGQSAIIAHSSYTLGASVWGTGRSIWR